MDGDNAAADLQAPDDSQPEAREDTFFLPTDFPGADALKEGDSITLKVVAKTEDGIEVEQEGAGPEEPEDMGAALDKHMGTKGSY